MSDLISKQLILMELSTFKKVKAKLSGTVQTKEKEHKKRLPKNWTDVVFRRGKDIQLAKDDFIWTCVVCNNADGSCKYAICDDCHGKHLNKRRKKVAKLDLRRQSCHHELHNLIPFTNVFWCPKAEKNDGEEWKYGEEWKRRPQGCVLCEGMFVLRTE